MTEVGETRKIGVAIGIPEPFGGELQGWRERLGDPNARRIVPHVTLLPPTTVGTGALAEIEEHLRRVAARFKPFDLRLRGSATFLPVSSVVFVPLVQGIAECEQIEAQVGAMQTASGEVLGAIESIGGAVRAMGDSISGIASSVQGQRQAAAELSRTTTLAANAVSGVNADIGVIGTATEATSAGASEMTSAALELARLSTDLRTHVVEFLEQIR